eukprot:TRINITY_DN28919_c0_g1_i1.p2 TRINITY_DN28919_c0_g1~~TRINITY_DN28919_c0_g1_i1.p2  ORF type:complete len:900 (+),score=477.49 TRINITY_DN28919_c0_g1_i1:43-2700(+)
MSQARKRSEGQEEKAIVRKYRQFVRIRPLMESEKKKNSQEGITNDRSGVEADKGEIMFMDPKGLAVNAKVNPTVKKKYPGYDGVFWSFGEDPWVREGREKTVVEKSDIEHINADNKAVYDEVKGDIVEMLYDGYNQTIAAYGAMNGGKTYTLFGNDKEDGVAPLIIKDILDQIQSQIEQRQAPGEKLEMFVEAQLLRIYKEEVEDMLAGYPRLPKDGAKINISDSQNATKLQLHDESQMKGFADRCWGGKESTRKPSNLTTPNKNNRSSVLLIITVTQKSTFQGDAEQTESLKSSTLTIADIGHGPKADNENAVDFKKINLAQNTFQQVLRKLGEKASHVPYNTSVLTRALQGCLSSSHVTLICNISPYHKSQAETGSFLELADFGAKAKTKVSPNEGAELAEFREKLEEQNELIQAAAEESKAAMKVKAELEGRGVKITELKQALKEGAEDIEALEADIDSQEKKIIELQWQIRAQRTTAQSVLEYFDRREASAKKDLDEYNRRMEELKQQIEKNEKRTAKQKEEIEKANNLLKKVAGLKSLLTGKPMTSDDVFAPGTDDELAKAQEQEEPTVFDQQAEEAAAKLKVAIQKYEAVVSMNEENSKLLAEIQTVLTEVDEVEGEKAQVKEAVNRNKRQCMREIISMTDDFTRGRNDIKGGLQMLDDIIEKYAMAGDKEAMEFFRGESNNVNSVLGSDLIEAPANSTEKIPELTEKAPLFLQPMEEMTPIRPWYVSMRPSKKTVDGNDGTAGGAGGDAETKFKVDKVSQQEIERQYAVLQATMGYTEKILLRYYVGRKAIEEAFQEWFERTPTWPTNANTAVNLCNELIAQQKKIQGLKADIKQLEEEISSEEAELKKQKGLVDNKTKAKRAKQEELKIELEKCVIL